MRRSAMLLVVLGLVAVGARAEVHAVLIGIDSYDNADITPLRYTVKDVTGFRDVLIDPRYGAVPQANVTLLTPSSEGANRPTRANIMRAILTGARRTQAGDSMVLYFAGHGMQSAEGQFLLGVDADPLLLADTAVPLDRLPALLADARAEQIVLIIDACRNDPAAGRSQADNLLTEDFLKVLRPRLMQPQAAANPNRKVATWLACDVGERAWEMTESQHGVFSFHFLDGLRGGIRDEQGRVTLTRLAAFVEQRVAEWARQNGRTQTPRLDNPDGVDIVLTTPNEQPTTPTGPAVVALDAMLKVTTTPPGATVRLDNEGVGVTPLVHSVLLPDGQPKQVMLAVELDGYAPRRFMVTLTPGQTAEVPPLTLERLEQPIGPQQPVAQPTTPVTPPSQPTELPQWETVTVAVPQGGLEFESWRAEWAAGPDGLPIAFCPGGPVSIGRPVGQDAAEGPQTSVELQPFFISATEVTNQAYANYLNMVQAPRDPDGNPLSPEGMPLLWMVDATCDIVYEGKTGMYSVRPGREFHPVVAVTWTGAAAYALHFGMTLPTEAQWEAAAQGTSPNQPYPWGINLDPAACNTQDRYAGSVAVNAFPRGSSAIGALNMVGNVAEWTRDYYVPDYHEVVGHQADPWIGEPRGTGLEITIRGGSHEMSDELCSVWTRAPMSPFASAGDVGFRCVFNGDPTMPIGPGPGPMPPDDDDDPIVVTTTDWPMKPEPLVHPDTNATLYTPEGYTSSMVPPMNVVLVTAEEDEDTSPVMAYFKVAEEITDDETVLEGLRQELENLGVEFGELLDQQTADTGNPDITLERRTYQATAEGLDLIVVLDSVTAFGKRHGLVFACPEDAMDEGWAVFSAWLTSISFPN